MKTKKGLIIASIMMIAGLVLGACGFFTGAKLNIAMSNHGVILEGGSGDRTLKAQKDVKLDAFTSIDGKILNSNLRFVPSDHFGMDLTYYGEENKPKISVSNGALQMVPQAYSEDKIWFQISFNPNFNKTPGEIIIYYPKGTHLNEFNLEDDSGNVDATDFSSQSTDITCKYGNLTLKDASCGNCSIKLDSGNSSISSVNAATLKFKNSYGNCNFDSVKVSGTEESSINASSGKITMSNCSVPTLTLNNDYGSISLTSLKASRTHATLSSGSLNISNCSLGNAQVKSAYGNVRATGLTLSGADIRCSSGSISLDGLLNGKTTLHSDYGSINVKTSLPQSQYRCDFSTDYGKVTVNGKKYGKSISMPVNAKNSLDITDSSGDITAEFPAEASGKAA